MVREGNDRSAHAQDHRRMNLAVRVLIVRAAWLLLVLVEVADVHRNHRRLFLFDVEELNQALLQRVIEVHALVLL